MNQNFSPWLIQSPGDELVRFFPMDQKVGRGIVENFNLQEFHVFRQTFGNEFAHDSQNSCDS